MPIYSKGAGGKKNQGNQMPVGPSSPIKTPPMDGGTDGGIGPKKSVANKGREIARKGKP